MNESLLSYQVNATDHIVAVSENWTAFAVANDGAHLLPVAVLGRSLWKMVSDLPTRQIYEQLLRGTRRGAGPTEFRFRCDGPTHRRLLSMRMTATARNGVMFETSLLREDVRPTVALLDVHAPRNEDAAVQFCTWCMRVPVATGEWLELEEAIQLFDLFVRWPLPRVAHGMCPECQEVMTRTVDVMEERAGVS